MHTVAEPQNTDAEAHVLGAMILSRNAIDTCSEILGPDDFFKLGYGLIFLTIVEMHHRGEPVDATTLPDALHSSGRLEQAGGTTTVQQLYQIVPASANAAHYAKIVKEHAVLRRLLKAGQNIVRLALERPGTVDEILAQAEADLTSATNVTSASDFYPLAEKLEELKLILKAGLAGEAQTGLLTGFVDLDRLLSGFYPGQFIIIGARPSVGKSALAQNIAENVADQHKQVAFLTLEMSQLELNRRAIARAADVDIKRIVWGNPNPDDKEKLNAAWKALTARTDYLHVNDDGSVNPTVLRAQLRRRTRHPGLDLVVVDYLQLMTTGQREETRQAEVAAISRSLKLLAKDLDVPVLALCQMKRPLGKGENTRPTLSDLRESGALEQDADIVIFIHRTEEQLKDGTAEVIVAKNRMGAQGSIRLAYVGRRYSFKNLAKGTT